ncbi:MAG: hypothetical protein KC609_24370 [Myxococcales bacterium]|nr:hypothetical protein [Myxococcales bacterium]
MGALRHAHRADRRLRLLSIAVLVFVSATVGCSAPRTVTKPTPRPVVRPKPRPKPPTPTPFQRAERQIREAEQHQETLRQIWRIDKLWVERLGRALDHAVGQGVKRDELLRMARGCYGEKPKSVRKSAPFLAREGRKGGRSEALRRGTRQLGRLKLGLQSCQAERHLAALTSRSPKILSLRQVLALADELRVLLRLDRIRRERDLERWRKVTKGLENELIRFEKSVILPTFKDPDSTREIRRVARKKLSEVRRLRRRLRAVARHLQRDWAVHQRRSTQFGRRVERLLAVEKR